MHFISTVLFLCSECSLLFSQRACVVHFCPFQSVPYVVSVVSFLQGGHTPLLVVARVGRWNRHLKVVSLLLSPRYKRMGLCPGQGTQSCRVRVAVRSIGWACGWVMTMVNSYALFIALKCVVVFLMDIAIMHCQLHCCTSISLLHNALLCQTK